MADKTEYSNTALALLKANLGYYGSLDSQVELYLTNLLNYAYMALTNECKIQLAPGDVYDDQLQSMYAAWLYRKGASGGAKPPMLHDAIRNRQTANALKQEEAL